MNGFTSYEDWCEYQISLIEASKERCWRIVESDDEIIGEIPQNYTISGHCLDEEQHETERDYVVMYENQDETERDYVVMDPVKIEPRDSSWTYDVMSHYPDTCYECGHPSYNGNFVDCSNPDCKNWRGK